MPFVPNSHKWHFFFTFYLRMCNFCCTFAVVMTHAEGMRAGMFRNNPL